ncbi:MAG: hypothetical protein HYX80_06170 [Chloroflexi bacterium]|nr:hypothetical protein [Chloroflexota bacterium]
MSMKRTLTIGLLFMALAGLFVFLSGCGVVGANVRLDGLALGAIDMEGKSLQGLPSDKINLDLDVAAQTIKVRTSGSVTTLTMVPSGATIEIAGDKVSFKGFKPDQIKVEWVVKPAE